MFKHIEKIKFPVTIRSGCNEYKAINFLELMALLRGFQDMIDCGRRGGFYVYDGFRVGGYWEGVMISPAENLGHSGFQIFREFAQAERVFKLRAAALTGSISV